MNDRDLETEINSLIDDLNGTRFEQEKNSNPTTAESYPIRKQITKLKRELCDTQNMFVNAKNLLSNISFENVNENFMNEVSSIGEKCQLMHNDQCEGETFLDSLCEMVHQCHDIPELHAMAIAVKELKCGISKMETNHLLLADLYEDVWKSVACSDSDSTMLIPQKFDEIAAEKMLEQAMLDSDDNWNV